jgi:membrane protein YdbS with pleckstrin-like domain
MQRSLVEAAMTETETELRELAKRRVKARTEFVTHVVAYLVANIGFVVIWWFSATDYPWFVWPMLVWGIGIASHAMTLFLGPDSERQEQAIERQLRRLHGRHP